MSAAGGGWAPKPARRPGARGLKPPASDTAPDVRTGFSKHACLLGHERLTHGTRFNVYVGTESGPEAVSEATPVSRLQPARQGGLRAGRWNPAPHPENGDNHSLCLTEARLGLNEVPHTEHTSGACNPEGQC